MGAVVGTLTMQTKQRRPSRGEGIHTQTWTHGIDILTHTKHTNIMWVFFLSFSNRHTRMDARIRAVKLLTVCCRCGFHTHAHSGTMYTAQVRKAAERRLITAGISVKMQWKKGSRWFVEREKGRNVETNRCSQWKQKSESVYSTTNFQPGSVCAPRWLLLSLSFFWHSKPREESKSWLFFFSFSFFWSVRAHACCSVCLSGCMLRREPRRW